MTGTVSVVTRGVHAAFACVADLVPDLAGTAGLASRPAAHRAGRMLLAELLAVTAGARLAGRAGASRPPRPPVPARSSRGRGQHLAQRSLCRRGGRTGRPGRRRHRSAGSSGPRAVRPVLCGSGTGHPRPVADAEKVAGVRPDLDRPGGVCEMRRTRPGRGPWRIPVEVGQRHGSWHDITWRTLPDQHAAPVSCAFELEGDR